MCLLIADPKRAKRRLRRFASFGSASTAMHPRPWARLSNISDDCRSAGCEMRSAPRSTVRLQNCLKCTSVFAYVWIMTRSQNARNGLWWIFFVFLLWLIEILKFHYFQVWPFWPTWAICIGFTKEMLLGGIPIGFPIENALWCQTDANLKMHRWGVIELQSLQHVSSRPGLNFLSWFFSFGYVIDLV